MSWRLGAIAIGIRATIFDGLDGAGIFCIAVDVAAAAGGSDFVEGFLKGRHCVGDRALRRRREIRVSIAARCGGGEVIRSGSGIWDCFSLGS